MNLRLAAVMAAAAVLLAATPAQAVGGPLSSRGTGRVPARLRVKPRKREPVTQAELGVVKVEGKRLRGNRADRRAAAKAGSETRRRLAAERADREAKS